MRGRIHVAGAGVISAIGNSVSETFESLKHERMGIGHLTLFDSVHKGVLPVGEVKHTNESLCDHLGVKSVTRTALLGIHAAREAVISSGIDMKRWRTGLISATTVGGMDLTENFFPEFLSNPHRGRLRNVIHHACGHSTELIADDLNMNGFVSTINTACSSSVNAIMLGSRMIDQGMLDVVVAGGTDALTKFTINGFNSLMILDRNLCRPFDANRNGLNLGEGAGFIVLVSDKVRQAEGLKTDCFVAGFANTNDAFHQTASSPEGRGSYGAMQQTLAMSGLNVLDIDYINLHGTGTQNNDLSEGTAVKRLFGDKCPPVSSTKAFTGHTLGASGGIEAVFSVLAIREQCVFPNLRFETAIPEVEITPQLVFESGISVNHVMSNSFGFGGNCSSIVFSKS